MRLLSPEQEFFFHAHVCHDLYSHISDGLYHQE
jgi:hypothetical protein